MVHKKGWGYFNTSNFTSQVFDANKTVNWSFISWSIEANDKGISNQYQSDISDLINASTVLYMKFDNATGESERQLNVTYNISSEVNLVLYMPFDSANAFELTPNGSTVLLMHFNNDIGTGENASLFLNNASSSTGGLPNGTCDLTDNECPVFNMSNAKLGAAGMEFDDSNDFINLTDNSVFDFSANNWIAAEAWIKTTGNDQAIIRKLRPGPITGYRLYVIATTSLGFWGTSIDGTGQSASGGPALNDNQWHHVLGMSQLGTRHYLYVDGILVAETADTTTGNIANDEGLIIGAAAGSSDFFKGTMDEVAVWNRSLTEAEIKSIYKRGVGKIT